MKKTNVQKLIAILIIGLLMMGGMESCNKDKSDDSPIIEIRDDEPVYPETMYDESKCTIHYYQQSLEKEAFEWGDSVYNVIWGITPNKLNKSFVVVDNPDVEKLNLIDNYTDFYVETKHSKRPTIGNTYFNENLIVCFRLFENKDIEVYIYPKSRDGFASGGYLFLKLGQPNKGLIFNFLNKNGSYEGDCVRYEEGMHYVFFRTNIDNLATGDPNEQEDTEMDPENSTKERKHGIYKLFPLEYGVINIFPLILSDNDSRYYTNPIYIKSGENGRNPEMVLGIDYYAQPYGTVNGVRVINDGIGNGVSSVGKYKGMFQTFQCSELDRRYARLIYQQYGKQVDAKLFHSEKTWQDNYEITKLSNIMPTEGDLLESSSGKWGHVSVISKIDWDNNRVFIAQQNASKYKDYPNYNEPILAEAKLTIVGNGCKIGDGVLSYDYILRPKSSNTKASDIKNDFYFKKCELSSDKGEFAIGEQLKVMVETNIQSDIYYELIDIQSLSSNVVPTNREGSFIVRVTAKADGKEIFKDVKYKVVDKKELVFTKLEFSPNKNQVEIGESLKIIAETNTNSDIYYEIVDLKSLSSNEVPTNQAGIFTVRVTAKADGKEIYQDLKYTVESKTGKLQITNCKISPISITEGDNVYLSIETSGCDCSFLYTIDGTEYTASTSPIKLTYSTAKRYSVTVKAIPSDSRIKSVEWPQSLYFDVSKQEEQPTPQITSVTITGYSNSISNGDTKDFDYGDEVQIAVETDIDCDEISVDFPGYSPKSNNGEKSYQTPWFDATESGKVTITATKNGKSSTFYFNIDVKEKTQNVAPKITEISEIGGNGSLQVENDVPFDVKTDQECIISVYDEKNNLLDEKTGKDVFFTIKDHALEVGDYKLKIKAKSTKTNLETEKVISYTVNPIRIANSTGNKSIKLNGDEYVLKPNTTDDAFVVDYRGKGIFRVYKSNGQEFGTSGDFYIYNSADFESGLNCFIDICWAIAHEEKDGKKYYDLTVSESYRGVKLYLFECHEGGGYYIGPFSMPIE